MRHERAPPGTVGRTPPQGGGELRDQHPQGARGTARSATDGPHPALKRCRRAHPCRRPAARLPAAGAVRPSAVRGTARMRTPATAARPAGPPR
ncbi:hypothetical protein E7X38_24390 [Streptomyces sp. Akac8]|nr:hypothetical protein E7X38_24390 [Streptomyces sp. Akac8]